MAEGRCGLRPDIAALRRRPDGDGARVAARRDARRGRPHRSFRRSDLQPRAHRRAGHDRRRPLLLRLLDRAKRHVSRRRPGPRRRRPSAPTASSSRSCARNNLYVVDVATQQERALTTDGGREILNGKLDWLYQEEIYGRGRFRGYWWSPDSSRLAFLQLDERPVPEYTVVDHIPYRPALEVTDYPKAGDPNPAVKLGVARVDRRRAVWVDLTPTSATRLPHRRTSTGRRIRSSVVHQVQDREQTWLDLNLADADTGRVAHAAARDDQGVGERERRPRLAEGRLVPLVQRAQRLQAPLSHREPTARWCSQVTTGRWDVRTLYGVDETRGAALLRGQRAQPDRHRHLPHQARRHRPHAALADRRHAPRDLQSRRSRSTSTSGAT